MVDFDHKAIGSNTIRGHKTTMIFGQIAVFATENDSGKYHKTERIIHIKHQCEQSGRRSVVLRKVQRRALVVFESLH